MDETPETIALFNAKAGGGRAGRNAVRLQSKLPHGCRVIECASREELEAEAFAAAERGAMTIIAIGGDGTIHHAANGVLRATESRSALAVLPSGTANDYWATLRDYATRAGGGETLVDVGEVRQGSFRRYFVNALGIGFSAETAAAAQAYHRWPPRLRYLMGVLTSLRHSWALTPMRIGIDDSEAAEAKLFLLSIAKGRREGSFTLAPTAKLDDALLQVLTARELRRRDALRYLPGVCVGRLPTRDARISYATARRIRLRPTRPLRFHLDGELFGDSLLPPEEETEVALHPKRLRVRFLEPG
jgi:diacylglycerol kinase (ATP)